MKMRLIKGKRPVRVYGTFHLGDDENPRHYYHVVLDYNEIELRNARRGLTGHELIVRADHLEAVPLHSAEALS